MFNLWERLFAAGLCRQSACAVYGAAYRCQVAGAYRADPNNKRKIIIKEQKIEWYEKDES